MRDGTSRRGGQGLVSVEPDMMQAFLPVVRTALDSFAVPLGQPFEQGAQFVGQNLQDRIGR